MASTAMLATMTNPEARITTPWITGRSWLEMLCTTARPSPGRPNTLSVTMAPPRTGATSMPNWGMIGGGGPRGPVPPPPLAQTLGAGGADVVLAEGLEQRAARQAGVHRRGDERQSYPGEYQVARPLQRILGDPGVRAGRREEGNAVDGEDVEEDIQEQQTDDEGRHRETGQHEHGRGPVPDAARTACGENADADARGHPDDRRTDGERDVHRLRPQHDLRHR